MKESFVVITGILFLSFVLNAFGCFITNCPPGGKRSGTDLKSRQCESCTVNGMNGQCYGPHICCSTIGGCSMRSIEKASCLQENLLHTTPCQNSGENCSGDDEANPINGQCAAFGICCSPDTCTTDINCQNREDEQKMNGRPFHKILPHFMLNWKHTGIRKPLRIVSTGNQNPILDRISFIPEGNKGSNEEY